MLAPLRTDLEVAGVVEIFQRSDTGPNVQRGYLRFLLEMCELAGDFLKSRQLRHFSDRQVLWSRLEDFTRTVHASLEPIETAYTIANEGRRLIECDRVSVAIRKGNKCVIEAVSGQDVFDKRSNTIRLLGRLASAVVRSGEADLVHGRHARTWPRKSRRPSRSTSTSRTRRRWPCCRCGARRRTRRTIRRSAPSRRRPSGR